MQNLYLIAVALVSYTSLVAAEIAGYRGLARGIAHEARAIMNVLPLDYGRAEDRKLVARQDPATVTVTVTSIPEYCTTSASNIATESTPGLSTGAHSPSQTGAVTGVPNGSVPGNFTSVLNGATETQGTPSGGVPVVPIPTAGQSVASPSATSNGSYISSSLASNLSSTIPTSSTAPASMTSEIASSTTSALPTSNNAASHSPGPLALAALLITFMVV